VVNCSRFSLWTTTEKVVNFSGKKCTPIENPGYAYGNGSITGAEKYDLTTFV